MANFSIDPNTGQFVKTEDSPPSIFKPNQTFEESLGGLNPENVSSTERTLQPSPGSSLLVPQEEPVDLSKTLGSTTGTSGTGGTGASINIEGELEGGIFATNTRGEKIFFPFQNFIADPFEGTRTLPPPPGPIATDETDPNLLKGVDKSGNIFFFNPDIIPQKPPIINFPDFPDIKFPDINIPALPSFDTSGLQRNLIIGAVAIVGLLILTR